MITSRLFVYVMCVFPLTALSADASSADETLAPDGIAGTLVIVGGGVVPDSVPELISKSIGADGTVVVLGDASEAPDAAAASSIEWFGEHGIANCHSVPAAENDRITKLVELLDQSSALWLCGGQQSRLAALDRSGAVEAAVSRVLERGGLVGGTSAGAAIMSKVMIESGRDEPVLATGWDLLPGAIVDQHFSERGRVTRSRLAVGRHPDRFGLGVDESTAVIVNGRRMVVTGQGTATVLFAKCAYREAEELRIPSGDFADLTQLRRAAQQRAFGIDPGIPQLGRPHVANGSLVIVGGGSMPPDVVDRFVELAGGEAAKIVVLPTAVSREQATGEGVPRFLARTETTSVTVLPQRGVAEVHVGEFRAALAEATGIWFGGGRQWNFVDAYANTDAVHLFNDVLTRGGVIGGSSAGATIQGEFLVRGHPLGNTVMMAEGYERGFAFLPGTAIDQHFAQRGRFPDLLPVIQRHSQMLGIGIDEGTAIVVRGSTADVIGLHSAHFLASKKLAALSADAVLPESGEEAASFYVTVRSGESVELSSLKD